MASLAVAFATGFVSGALAAIGGHFVLGYLIRGAINEDP